MSRVEIPEAVITTAGAAVSGASVQVNVRSSGAAATVYTSATGGATVANPISTDVNGRIEGWLEEGAYDLVVSGTGITTYTQRLEAGSGVQSPGFLFTAAGDLLYGSAANSAARLAAGTSVQTMHSGTTPRWAQVTDEDVASTASLSSSKVAVGAATASQVMSVVAGLWAARTIPASAIAQISDSTLAASATSFDIAAIPATYNHLLVWVFARSTNAADEVDLRLILNNDSAGNYSWHSGRDAVATHTPLEVRTASNAAMTTGVPGANRAAGAFGASAWEIPNYADASYNQPIVGRWGWNESGFGSAGTLGGIWAAVAAVNRLTFTLSSGNFAIGSRVTVYGVT